MEYEEENDTLVVSLISQKGGVSKSSICRALAREGAVNGLTVKLADLDMQQTTSIKWAVRRLEAGIKPDISAQPFKTVEQALSNTNGIDLLVVDGPARSSAGTLEIAKKSDLVIQPTGASLDDLEPAILLFNDLIREGIPRNKLFIALSRVGTESEEQAARDYIEQANLNVLDGCFYEQAAYRQAQNLGYAFTEVKFKNLQKKADALIQSLINKLPTYDTV